MSKLIESSAIKLFGKTIPLLTLNQKEDLADDHELSCERNLISSSNSLGGVNSDDGDQGDQAPREDHQEVIEKEFVKDKHEGNTLNQIKEDLEDPIALSGITNNSPPTSPLPERKSSLLESSKNDEKTDNKNASQEKANLKKPDKILPCPRCNSKKTKFCYYNNYNVNQPRHFCKNCQRYWTEGGNMRNVPVGAGRRKTKSSSAPLQYHHIVISEAIKAAQASVVNGILRNPSCENNNNSRVITFGSDSSLPVASSITNLSEKTQTKNGFPKPDRTILVEGNNHSGESSLITSYSIEKEGKASLNQTEDKNYYQWFPCKVPYLTRPSWPYPWDSIQWNSAIFPSKGFPVSFHPAQICQNYNVPNGPWDVPVASPSASSSVNQSPPSSSSPSTSPILGKHLRDGNILRNSAKMEKEKLSDESYGSEELALNSNSLRIDDPGEPEKSAMLATLLVKSKKNKSISSGGLFEGFQSDIGHHRNYRQETISVLQANPAALSRSLNFQENT